MSEQRPARSTLLGAVLSAGEPPASLLARYVQSPESLTAEERECVERHEAQTPLVRDQIRALRRLTATAAPGRSVTPPSGLARLRGISRPVRPGSPVVWVPTALAAGVAVLFWVTDLRVADLRVPEAEEVAVAEGGFAEVTPERSPRVEMPGTQVAQGAGVGPSDTRVRSSVRTPEPDPPDPRSAVPADRPPAPPAPAIPETPIAATGRRADDSTTVSDGVTPAPVEAPGEAIALDTSPRTRDTADPPAEVDAAIILAQLLRVDRARTSSSIDLDVRFDPVTDEPTPEGQGALREIARALLDPRLAGDRFLLEVHTDDRGPADENLQISERRAAAALRYLRSQLDLDPERIQAVGRGEEAPATAGSSEALRAINRRVTLERRPAD